MTDLPPARLLALGLLAAGCGGADGVSLSVDRDVIDECGGACAVVLACRR